MVEYVFALCAPGAERALKREVERRELPWASSYQRPGFVTFRTEEGVPDPLPAFTWARERSLSVGRAALPWTPEALREQLGAVEVLRVSAREPALDPVALALAEQLGVTSPAAPRAGDVVGELVVVGPEELWLGAHTHDVSHSPRAGGVWPSEPPPEAPSRAYLKLEAVLASWGCEPAAGEHALELGSAPGGATWALLSRGLHVTGVDPADMDPRIIAHPNYRHVRGSISVLPVSQLPARTDWLLADMNVPPRQTLRAARRVLDVLEVPPRALVLTLKLKDWALAEQVSSWTDLVRSWGYREVRARQLGPHRQELAITAR